MLGSPPSAAAALPSFSFLDDDSAHRVASDTDFLPAWSTTLSPSPKLTPTIPSASTSSSAAAATTGLNAFATSSHSTKRAGVRAGESSKGKHRAPDVGTGLSPVLGPTHLGPTALALDVAEADLGEAVFSPIAGRSAFESSFSQYAKPASTDSPATRRSPIMRRKRLSNATTDDAPAPLSAANVATLTSLPGASASGSQSRRASTSVQNPSRRQSLTEDALGQRAYAQALPEGLQRRSTAVSSPGEEAPQIQVSSHKMEPTANRH